MKVFYFTATGNSLAVAKEIGGELYSIPQVLKKPNLDFSADKIGIVFPCYYLGIPRVVKKFIQRVNLESDYIFAIMTYGNLSANGVHQFERLAKEEGIELDYTNQLLMVDNYLPLFAVEDQLAQDKNIEENLEEIIHELKDNKRSLIKQSWWQRILNFFSQSFYKFKLDTVDKNFAVADTCTACKICEQVCPVDNIEVKEKPNYKHHCEECLACIHLCPENAISLNKEKSNQRFKNGNVDLKEILKANQ